MSGWAYRGEMPERGDDATAGGNAVPPRGDGVRAHAAQDAADGVGGLGRVIANRYVLESYIGHGRYGEVYRALDRSLSDPELQQEHRVALHLLHDRIAEQSHLLDKLESAYLQPYSWSHPNVVKVRGFGCDGGRYFLAMELLDGATLRSIIDATPSELLSETETLAVLRGVGDALQFAHAKGVVHGDVRPEKIFITHEYAIKVLDLLPASSAREVPFFAEDEAPQPLPDPRDDVYGLACVAYELLSGRHPFNANSPLEALHAGLTLKPIAGLDPARSRALARALALRREQRTASVAEFLAEIGVAGDETLYPPRDASAAPEAAKPKQPADGRDADGASWRDAAPPPGAAAAAGSPARASMPAASAPAPHRDDDDVPILFDYATAAARAGLRPAAPPRPPPEPQVSLPAIEPEWPRHSRDFDVYADARSRLGKQHEPRGGGLRLALLAVVAAAIGAGVYWYYQPLRGLALEWYAMAQVLAGDLLRARSGAPAGEETPPAAAEGRAAVEAPVIATATPAPDAQSAAAPIVPVERGDGAAAPGGQEGGRANAPTSSGAEAPGAAAPVSERRAETADEPAAPPLSAAESPERAPSSAPRAATSAAAAAPVAEGSAQAESLELPSVPVTVAEGDAVATVVIRRSGGAFGESSFVWWTSDGSAVADEDYANLGARMETFAAGQESLVIHLPIVVDARREDPESFYLNVRPADRPGARLDAAQRIEVRIVDDD